MASPHTAGVVALILQARAPGGPAAAWWMAGAADAA